MDVNSLIHRTTGLLPGHGIPLHSPECSSQAGQLLAFQGQALEQPLFPKRLRERFVASVVKHGHSQELESTEPSQPRSSSLVGCSPGRRPRRRRSAAPGLSSCSAASAPCRIPGRGSKSSGRESHPTVIFPGAGGGSPGLQKLLWGDISTTNRKTPSSQQRRVVRTRNFRVVALQPLLSCFFPNWEEAVLFGQAPLLCPRVGTAPGWSPRAHRRRHKVQL